MTVIPTVQQNKSNHFPHHNNVFLKMPTLPSKETEYVVFGDSNFFFLVLNIKVHLRQRGEKVLRFIILEGVRLTSSESWVPESF